MAPLARVPFAATLILTVATVVALFGVVSPIAHEVISPTVLPAPFTEQNQDTETLLFVLTFLFLLPLSLFVAVRAVDAAGTAGVSAGDVTRTVALLGAALLALVVLVKASERASIGSESRLLLAASCLWLIGSVATMLAAAKGRTLIPTRLSMGVIAAVTLAALFVLMVCFAKLGSISIVPFAVMAAAVAALVKAPLTVPALPRPWGRAVDAVVVVLLLFAIPNVVIFAFGDPSPAAASENTILQFHQNFFLGPANQVLGGDAMLVGTLSQYGVGSIDFLAAVFQVIPIGNGTLGLIEGLLAASTFIGGYLALRAALASRLLACSTLLVGVIVLVYGLQFPIGGLLQHGAIRFGLPMGIVLAAVAEARWPQRALAARVLGLLTVAIASIWALEAFAYTVITLAGTLLTTAFLLPAGGRLRWLLRRSLEALAACIVAHLAFAAVTLAATGELPDWGMYLHTLREFLTGGIGDLTYDFSPWSPALGVAGIYVASAAATALLVARGVAEADRPAVIAIGATTAYGIALFSYFVNRSADHIIAYVSLPAVMVVALWLALLLRPSSGASSVVRRVALVTCAAAAALLVAVAWSSAGNRLSQSALGHVVPGGESLHAALHRLWYPPELAPGADEGERLLEQYMPGESVSLVVTAADLAVEVLIHTDRTNRLPLADPWEDSLVPLEHLPALRDAIDSLEPGDRILLDAPALKVFRGYLREPQRDPLRDPFSRSTLVPSGIAILQEWELKEIGERFRLEPVARGSDGLEVARLVPREGG